MLKRTFSTDKISSVLKDPTIWPCIADDMDKESTDIPLDDNHYLYQEGTIIILHPKGDDWQIHVNVLPDYRNGAMDSANEALYYAFNTLDAERVIAYIPQDFGNVYNFALKFMKDQGIRHDNHYLTLTEEEWDSLDS